MKTHNIVVFDTTLRDGEQSPGVSMSVEDKVEIAKQLEKFGVDVIEAGFAFASPADFEAITKISQEIKDVCICSLARATRKDIDCAHEALKNAKNGRIHTFIATSDIHLKYKLKKTKEEVIEIIKASVSYARNLCDNIEWSAEDATRTDIDFLIKCVQTAIDNGATTINLPDTVGFCYPQEYQQMFETVIANTKNDGVIFSTHCHNDLGMATANSISGTIGGARQIECCVNGIGERAGNTATEEIVMAFKVRKNLGFDTNIDTKQIKQISDTICDISGFSIQPNKAIVGKNAFLHESGIHQDGVLKNKSTYEIIDPKDVGIETNNIVLGKLSGRSALKAKIQEMGYKIEGEDLKKIFEKFKEIAGRKKFIVDEDIIRIMKDCGFIDL
ncbi:MAG: 2-isopropylmalate synthase [Rickettsiales bacterium]|nr:2-isopropylmalate synthase [Rickettsiales bacterium]